MKFYLGAPPDSRETAVINEALVLAEEEGGLEAWEDQCFELMDALRWKLGEDKVDCLWVDIHSRHRWAFHVVPVIDGVVHDAWHPEVMEAPRAYVQRVFGGCSVSAEMNPGADL